MLGPNYLAAAAAAFFALVASFAWYLVLGRQWRALSGQVQNGGLRDSRFEFWKMLGEVGRNLVLALVIQYFVVRLGTERWADAVVLGSLLWIGFPVILLTGSMMRESYPWKLATIHAGDWLVKLVLITLTLSLWR